MVNIKKVDGKWKPIQRKTLRDLSPTRKYRSKEESALITQKRQYNIPFTIKAQEFDISSWFNLDQKNKTWSLTDQKKQQYDIITDNAGKIIGIQAKPKVYESSKEYRYRRSGTDKQISTSSYKPHDIAYREKGLLDKETQRGIYTYDTGGDEDYYYSYKKPYVSSYKEWGTTKTDKGLQALKRWDTHKPYTTKEYDERTGDEDWYEKAEIRPDRLKTYHPQGILKHEERWDDYQEKYKRFPEYEKEYYDKFKEEEWDYDVLGRPIKKQEWDTRLDWRDTYADGSIADYDVYKQAEKQWTYDDTKNVATTSTIHYPKPPAHHRDYSKYKKKEVEELKAQDKKHKEFVKEFESAKTDSEKSAILKKYNELVTLTIPFTTYIVRGNDIEQIYKTAERYYEKETNEQRNRRYQNMMKKLPMEEVRNTIYKENPSLEVQDLAETKEGRQEILNRGLITGVVDLQTNETKPLTEQQKSMYVETGGFGYQWRAPIVPEKRYSVMSAYDPSVKPVQDKWYMKALKKVDKTIVDQITNTGPYTGMFSGTDPLWGGARKYTRELGEEIKAKDDWIKVKGDKWYHKAGRVAQTPLRIQLAGLTAVGKPLVDLSTEVGKTVQGAVAMDKWDWDDLEHETKRKELASQQQRQASKLKWLDDDLAKKGLVSQADVDKWNAEVNKLNEVTDQIYDIDKTYAFNEAKRRELAEAYGKEYERQDYWLPTTVGKITDWTKQKYADLRGKEYIQAKPDEHRWYDKVVPATGMMALYGTKDYWKHYLPKRAENVARFFSEPLHWHPYGAIGHFGYEAYKTKGKSLGEFAQYGLRDPAGIVGDFYLIHKVYGGAKAKSRLRKRIETKFIKPEKWNSVKQLKKTLPREKYIELVRNLKGIQSMELLHRLQGISPSKLLTKIDWTKLKHTKQIQQIMKKELSNMRNVHVEGSLSSLSAKYLNQYLKQLQKQGYKLPQKTKWASDIDASIKPILRAQLMRNKFILENPAYVRALFQKFGERSARKIAQTGKLKTAKLEINWKSLTPEQRISVQQLAMHKGTMLKGSPVLNMIIEKLYKQGKISKKTFKETWKDLSKSDVDFSIRTWRRFQQRPITKAVRDAILKETGKKYKGIEASIKEAGGKTKIIRWELKGDKWVKTMTKTGKPMKFDVDFRLARLVEPKFKGKDPFFDLTYEQGIKALQKDVAKFNRAHKIIDAKTGKPMNLKAMNIDKYIHDQINRLGFQQGKINLEKGFDKLVKLDKLGLLKKDLKKIRFGKDGVPEVSQNLAVRLTKHSIDAKIQIKNGKAGIYVGKNKLADIKDFKSWSNQFDAPSRYLKEMGSKYKVMSPWESMKRSVIAEYTRGLKHGKLSKDFLRQEMGKGLRHYEMLELLKNKKMNKYFSAQEQIALDQWLKSTHQIPDPMMAQGKWGKRWTDLKAKVQPVNLDLLKFWKKKQHKVYKPQIHGRADANLLAHQKSFSARQLKTKIQNRASNKLYQQDYTKYNLMLKNKIANQLKQINKKSYTYQEAQAIANKILESRPIAEVIRASRLNAVKQVKGKYPYYPYAKYRYGIPMYPTTPTQYPRYEQYEYKTYTPYKQGEYKLEPKYPESYPEYRTPYPTYPQTGYGYSPYTTYGRYPFYPEYPEYAPYPDTPDTPTSAPPETKDRKWDKKKHEKKGKYKTHLRRFQDPWYRVTAQKKYSDILNKLLRERYGNIYS